MQQSMPQEKDWEKFWIKDASKVHGTETQAVSWSKRRIQDVLKKYVAKDKRALEAGSGSGFFSAYFCDCGMKTTAIDYSDQALDMTKNATGGRAKILKINLLDKSLTSLLAESFDLVFTDGLFEHFSDFEQDRILSNLMSVLAPGGVVATFVPNRWSPWELIRPFYMPGIKEVPFQLKQLIRLNERSGLKVIEQGGVNTLPLRFSPDKLLGPTFGMLLYTVAKKATTSA